MAYSRLAVIRYHAAFQEARDELLAQSAALSEQDRTMDDEVLCTKPPMTQALVQAWRYRDTLARIEFAPVISGGNNDDPTWRQWSDGHAQEARIKRFKKPLFHKDPGKTDPLAFLIVKSMLLTGFDAPIEGVLYLDRSIREAELLQAVARVNRTGFGKTCGIVVDYFGVAHHLKAALAAYSDEDIQGALVGLNDQIPVLRDRHIRVVDIFRRAGLDDLSDDESCLAVLSTEKARAEFTVKLKDFLTILDIILPRPEALPFVKDAKRLAFLQARARNRYRDIVPFGRFCIRRASLPRAVEIFTSWYTRKAQGWFEREVASQANRMGVEIRELKVQDLGYRWGSFGAGGRISFHWKAILLPPRIAQYVVIHELAHGHYPDHSPKFWMTVEQHLPDWGQRKSWLAEHGIQVEGI